ncbi:MAG: sugar kinase [Hyphomicrobiales bacterium]|nr:MAG: sugar kinase [Hyphomicrobiales bacterium]
MIDTSRSGVICAGNWIVDVIHDIDRWPQKNDLVRIQTSHTGIGGGAANVLSDLRSFEVEFPLIPVGKIGNDANGELILTHCKKFNFPTNFIIQDANSSTAHTQVMNLSKDSRTFFYHGGANDTLCQDDIQMDILAQKNAKIFYLGYPMLLQKLDELQLDGSTQAATILQQAKAGGMLTCVDLVSAESPKYQQIIAASLPHIDYLILNETELSRASGVEIENPQQELDHDLVLQAAQKLLTAGIGKAIIVHSPELGLWLAADQTETWVTPQHIPAEKIKSPVGAGDAFCAGIIFGIHQELPPKKTLNLAHSAARAALGGITATDGIQSISRLMPDEWFSTHQAESRN